MTVFIFTGPTLTHSDVRAGLDAVCLPPVSQGDVYCVARQGAEAIGIIDGYFDSVPSVWHKEILWAMAQGVHVYGSASMGALRAAELAAFGMEGVGAIFAAYRDGTLEDDDEVAVQHGPPDTGYRCLSEALVNIRATLAQAAAQAVIRPATRAALEEIAKALFYPERSYPLLLRRAAGHGLPAAEVDALGAWLPQNRIDQKRQDAFAMLRLMRAQPAANLGPKRVGYHLEHTMYWDDLMRAAGAMTVRESGATSVLTTERVLDELRLQGERYFKVREQALPRRLVTGEAGRQGKQASAAALKQTEHRFWAARGLNQPETRQRWLEENHLTRAQFEELIRGEAVLDRVRSRRSVSWQLLDQLRVTGEYQELSDRARDKQSKLEAVGRWDARLEDVGLTEEALLRWYFQRLQRPLEANLPQYASGLGYEDVNDLVRAVLREFCYVRVTEPAATDSSSGTQARSVSEDDPR
jgi:hypothetical protein